MILPRRRRRDSLDESGLDRGQLNDALQDAEEQLWDNQSQPESDSETPDQPKVRSESISQFDPNSEPQEPQRSNSMGPKEGRAAKGTSFRHS